MATREDVAYILEAITFMFPSIQLSPQQVESTWAGVRPLIFEEGKDPSEISRKDEIWESASGLVTIAGGKLTGYRKMAEMVVDRVCENTKSSSFGPSITKHLSLSGGAVGGSEGFKSFVEMKALEGQQYGLTYDESRHLAAFYGTNVNHLFAYANVLQNNSYGLPLPIAAKLAYAIQFEMTCTPADFFVRRTGDLYFNIDEVHTYKEQVCQMMKVQLGYSENQVDFYRFDLDKQVQEATSFREENG